MYQNNNDYYDAENARYSRPNQQPSSGIINLTPTQKKLLITVISIVMVVANIFAYGYSVVNSMFDDFNYQTPEPDDIVVSFTEQPPLDDDEGLKEGVSYTDVNADELTQTLHEVSVDDHNLFYQEDTTNILLLGTDSRSKYETTSRADAIILLSVNRNTKQIIMTSFMRDTAVKFKGSSRVDKLTHGHVYGGAPLMVNAIESHFGIKIDYYVTIDFYAFIDVVDYLGGVHLDISEGEMYYMNRYIKEMNWYIGVAPSDGFLEKPGTDILVTGKQALGFARNRYTGEGGDANRTSRQRIVLGKIIDRLKENPTKALGLLEAISPRVTTNYTQQELTSEALNLLNYISYDIIDNRLPIDDSWYYGDVDGVAVVVCDYKTNQRSLIKTIYGVDMDSVQAAD